MKNFSKNNSYLNFRRSSYSVLKKTLSSFFSADIVFLENELADIFKKNKMDLSNPEKEIHKVHIVNKNTILLLPKIYNKNYELIAFYGISIKKQGIGEDGGGFKIYNVIEESITRAFSKAYAEKYKNPIQYFDDNLIKHAIALYFCKGYYAPSKVIYLIDYLNKLRTTSFEGAFFSTGMILTKSEKNFIRQNEANKFATLTKSCHIVKDELDRRFWYLSDGKENFYICNRMLNMNHLFTLNKDFDKNNSTYMGRLLLKDILRGGDALFRVENEKEISIITSNQKEFIYTENHWKYRDYNIFKSLILSKIELNDEIFNQLLFFILHCSKNRISSIIWIPKDLSEIDNILKTKNPTTRNKIKIDDISYTSLIIRYLSSDGATIIDSLGEVRYFGCIIDMSAITISGVKGTGESASSILASNGISIKISQDGTIKLFLAEDSKAINL